MKIPRPDPKIFAASWIATAGGLGYMRWAPGTWGSLPGLALAYYLIDAPHEWLVRGGVLLALTALGTWAANEFDHASKSHDNQRIVIDEVAGQFLAAATARSSKEFAAAFILFRLFDILKPPPVRQLDRWSKKETSGFGVIADDLAAGALALGFVFALQTWVF